MTKTNLVWLVLGMGVALAVAVGQSDNTRIGQLWCQVDAETIAGGADCYLPVGTKCPGDDRSCSDLPCYSGTGCSVSFHDQTLRKVPVGATSAYNKGTVEADPGDDGWSEKETTQFYCIRRQECGNALISGELCQVTTNGSLRCNGRFSSNTDLRDEYILKGDCVGAR